MERCVPKVAELRDRFPEMDIEVDGGVSPKNIEVCAHAGKAKTFPVAFRANPDFRHRKQCHRCWDSNLLRTEP
jgi:pentose-5-phosphate-3-epimerase